MPYPQEINAQVFTLKSQDVRDLHSLVPPAELQKETYVPYGPTVKSGRLGDAWTTDSVSW